MEAPTGATRSIHSKGPLAWETAAMGLARSQKRLVCWLHTSYESSIRDSIAVVIQPTRDSCLLQV